MAITITSEQMYLDGVAQTTPDVVGDYRRCKAGMDRSTNTPKRWVTVFTCNTTTPISQVTLALTNGSMDNTSSTKYLGMYVTAAKNDTYLTDSTGGDTKLRFSCDCTDDGSFVANNTMLARGIVNKNIPSGTFYIYIVPYQITQNNQSNFYSISAEKKGTPPSLTGTEIPCCLYIDGGSSFESYQCYIDNGSGWDLYIPYIDNGSTWEPCG